jgi:hypothetical protein
LWDEYFPDTERPSNTTICICGYRRILTNFYIKNKEGTAIIILGSTCIDKSDLNDCRTCGIKMHGNTKGDFCKKCRKETKKTGLAFIAY